MRFIEEKNLSHSHHPSLCSTDLQEAEKQKTKESILGLDHGLINSVM
jgi:hypothetical protein